ncbi:hypothetical protein [Psychromicrobium xiongbiense]|uniref:hypothetical protein n=1 Tax=Psychromicrobium xiongbiense TaxID=3051184 RepID=UPI002556458C|nr:hypothetical protein [Psychromicrobium sp. YIM S02556]
MTEINNPDLPPETAAVEENVGEPELRGRYVKGTYSKAGTLTGRHSEDTEGQYTEGNYGEAGEQGNLPEPLGTQAGEVGRYVRGSYGDAGAAPARTAATEIGQYAKGDYGTEGTVGPLREAKADPE